MNDAITYNAAGSMVTSNLVKGVLAAIVTKYRFLPAKCVCHPAQVLAWEDITVNKVNNDVGIPVNQDIREPLDRIQFKDADDNVLGEIVSLASPLGFRA